MEQAAVNRKVVGSNPISGAKLCTPNMVCFLILFVTLRTALETLCFRRKLNSRRLISKSMERSFTGTQKISKFLGKRRKQANGKTFDVRQRLKWSTVCDANRQDRRFARSGGA